MKVGVYLHVHLPSVALCLPDLVHTFWVLAPIKVLRWADFLDTQMFPDLNNYYEQNKSQAKV